MKISPWHCEVAKRVAEGKKYKEISKEIQISQSRLSVLKANPLFCRYVDKYRKEKDDAWKKALGKIEENAEDIAKELVDIATGKSKTHVTDKDGNEVEVRENVGAQTRLTAIKEALDRVGMSKGQAPTGVPGQEMTFEQILRITKRSAGQGEEESEAEVDEGSALNELEMDLQEDGTWENQAQMQDPPQKSQLL